MSLSVFHKNCSRFNPSRCCLSPFLLSYVVVSRPCCLSGFYPNAVSWFSGGEWDFGCYPTGDMINY